jgi:hypothetical protein
LFLEIFIGSAPMLDLREAPWFEQPNDEAWIRIGIYLGFASYLVLLERDTRRWRAPSGTTSIPSLNSVTSMPVPVMRNSADHQIVPRSYPAQYPRPVFALSMNFLSKYPVLLSWEASFTSSLWFHGGDQKILPGKNGPRTVMYDLRAKYYLR